MIVYVGSYNNDYLDIPVSITESFAKKFINYDNSRSTKLIQCPAVTDELKKTFTINCPIDYELTWDGNSFFTSYYDQAFFNSKVICRDEGKGLLSFLTPQVYFVAEESLEMTMLHPAYESSEFSEKTRVVSATYNIGKHIRPIETVFFFKKPDTVTIKQDDTLCYVRFNTSEKIEFIPFTATRDFNTLVMDTLTSRNYTKRSRPLSWWYEKTANGRFKSLLKMIRQNAS